MIPALVTALAKQKVSDKVSSKVTSAKNYVNENSVAKKILNIAMITGASLLGYKFVAKPMWDRYKRNQQNDKIFSDPNTQLASLLRTAIIGIGTDLETVYSVAKKIRDWNAVQNAYKNLTGNSLNQDLHEDLSSSQYQKFMTIVRQNLKANSNVSKRGYIVVSSKKVRLRNTPDSTISSWSFNSNILDTIDAKKFLGFATGAYKVDSEGVLYYQVRIKYLEGIPEYHKKVYEKQKGKILSFWLGAGAIDMFREFTQMRASYPSVKIYKGTKDTGLRQVLK